MKRPKQFPLYLSRFHVTPASVVNGQTVVDKVEQLRVHRTSPSVYTVQAEDAAWHGNVDTVTRCGHLAGGHSCHQSCI